MKETFPQDKVITPIEKHDTSLCIMHIHDTTNDDVTFLNPNYWRS